MTLKMVLSKMRVLSGQEFFVRDEVLLNALARKIMAHAVDTEHVERLLGTWVSRTKEMLRISDIAALASETQQDSRSELPEPCEVCGCMGYLPQDRQRDGIAGADGGYWVFDDKGSRRCSCARGQALRAMDRAREARKHAEVS